MSEQTAPLKSLFQSIATAIRSVNGTTDEIIAANFPAEISALSSLIPEELCTVSAEAVSEVEPGKIVGTVTGTGFCKKGMTVKLTAASSDEWYGFSMWKRSGYVISDENPLTLAVTSDTALQAEFHPIPYCLMELSVDPEGAGTVTGAGKYKYNSSVLIEAIPNEGYRFAYWANEAGAIIRFDNPYTIPAAMFSNNGGRLSYVAKFEAISGQEA